MFDYEQRDWIKKFKFVRELGLTFLDISKKVINRKKKLKSKSKNTAIEGRKLQGKVLMTFLNGELVFSQ